MKKAMPQAPRARATAFAPASIGNVGVGFDILGLAIPVAGDRVTVERVTVGPGEPEVAIDAITGVVIELPKDPSRNTAAVAVQAMLEALKAQGASAGLGFRLSIDKGIPLGSGMGGSAASAVGAAVAANATLERPFPPERLLEFALSGEEVASGSRHADNAAPCLYGGMVLTLSNDPLRTVQIPVPAGIHCVLVHPHLRIETRDARAVLRPQLTLGEHVRQSANLSAFISACYRSDLELIRASLVDALIEPQRSVLIPGFDGAKSAALAQGALGFSISGSGPSVFAWADSAASAERIRAAVVAAFDAHRIGADSWTTAMPGHGARVIA